MPDIYGKYTLTEIAKKINVVPTFINRVQRETGIGGKIGSKGKSASFDLEMISIFRMVKFLRMLDFSFRDIKELWKIEEDIIAEERRLKELEAGRFPSEYGLLGGNVPKYNTISLILHDQDVYYVVTKDDELRPVAVDPFFSKYEKLQYKFRRVSFELHRRQIIFFSEIKDMEKILNEKREIKNYR